MYTDGGPGDSFRLEEIENLSRVVGAKMEESGSEWKADKSVCHDLLSSISRPTELRVNEFIIGGLDGFSMTDAQWRIWKTVTERSVSKMLL